MTFYYKKKQLRKYIRTKNKSNNDQSKGEKHLRNDIKVEDRPPVLTFIDNVHHKKIVCINLAVTYR
jgi:hypothetical protein